MKKLAIITSHPIQYNAPLFRLLAERGKVQVKVFYTWGQTEQGVVYDPDFKKEFKWDIPLTEGYEKEFVENISANPGAGHFQGIKNRDLNERVRRYNPDAILVLGWSFHSHLQLLRHFSGKKKILFRGDSTLLDEPSVFSMRKTVRRLFLRWVYKHVDVALYTGRANKAYYLSLGLKASQLCYAPHAVANARFADPEGEHQQRAYALRKELGIPLDALVFLFAGKIEPKKDPLLLVDVFMRLEARDVRLVVTGNGVLEEEAKRRAKDDPRIHFLGFQNQQQMPAVYRLGDVFVLPSKGPGETWGLSVNEAMASGKPVVVSNRCGCAQDLVKENGVTFEAGSSNSLKEAILFFIENRKSIPVMEQRSMEVIRQFTHEQVAKAIEESV
ncbi:MAG: glycosyltransferase family 4 protein [Chitinophagaceae bacterium]|nr:glycosyltransferase family 4 protein [Chitinophagaceae bacterium]